MKPQHLRYFALMGLGALGLAMLIPSTDEGTAASPQPLRASLATSPTLSNYLDGQLRAAATPEVVETEELVLGNISIPSRRFVSDSTSVAPSRVESIREEFTSRSSIAVNVRAGPGSEMARLFVLPAGTPVRIEHTMGNWAKVVTADGKTGWAFASYFPGAGADSTGPNVAEEPSIDSVAAAPVATASIVERKQPLVTHGKPPKSSFEVSDNRKAKKAKAFRLANDTVLRASPSKGSNKISVAQGGAKLLVTEWDGAWARVILADGTSGWIKAR